MALNLDVGDAFPDVALPDDSGDSKPISEVAAGRPLVLAIHRGFW